ncbi:hypothetical protein BC826DRAFT_70524 [Russula brevipes]|nr:hypothetical protein BC826DRAFT_70524 [Russula brevipes]
MMLWARSSRLKSGKARPIEKNWVTNVKVSNMLSQILDASCADIMYFRIRTIGWEALHLMKMIEAVRSYPPDLRYRLVLAIACNKDHERNSTHVSPSHDDRVRCQRCGGRLTSRVSSLHQECAVDRTSASASLRDLRQFFWLMFGVREWHGIQFHHRPL